MLVAGVIHSQSLLRAAQQVEGVAKEVNVSLLLTSVDQSRRILGWLQAWTQLFLVRLGQAAVDDVAQVQRWKKGNVSYRIVWHAATCLLVAQSPDWVVEAFMCA